MNPAEDTGRSLRRGSPHDSQDEESGPAEKVRGAGGHGKLRRDKSRESLRKCIAMTEGLSLSRGDVRSNQDKNMTEWEHPGFWNQRTCRAACGG